MYLNKVVVWTDDFLTNVKQYAQAIGPMKDLLAPPHTDYERNLEHVNMAKTVGLFIHPWTYKVDSGIMSQFEGDFYAEQEYFYCCLKVDALFTEQPDRSREAVDGYREAMEAASGSKDHAKLSLVTHTTTDTSVCSIDCTKY